MSKKHVEEYYNTIANQYSEMLHALREMEEDCSNNLVSPDRLDQIKEMIKPIKDNYMRISYIMFLLNQPNRKKKQKEYEKRNKKLLKEIPNKDKLSNIKEENNKIISNLHL